MGHVQPFVAIVLGQGPQPDAEQLARAVGAIAILRPGQPHPVPLHPPDAVIDLAAPVHGGGTGEGVIDLAPADEARSGHDDVIDLIEPDHSEQLRPARMPGIAVVIDPAEVADVPGLVVAVHAVLDRLVVVTPACVVATRSVADFIELVDGAHVLLGPAGQDRHRCVSAPLAGPLDLLSAVAEAQGGDGETGPASVRTWLTALIQQGVEVHPVAI